MTLLLFRLLALEAPFLSWTLFWNKTSRPRGVQMLNKASSKHVSAPNDKKHHFSARRANAKASPVFGPAAGLFQADMSGTSREQHHRGGAHQSLLSASIREQPLYDL